MIDRDDWYNKDFLSNSKVGFICPTACCVWEKLEQKQNRVETEKSKATSTKKKASGGGGGELQIYSAVRTF
jgi:hypothetical protein